MSLSASFFYAIQVADGLKSVCTIGGACLGILFFCAWIEQPSDKRRLFYMIGSIAIFIVGLLIPSKDTLILMEASKYCNDLGSAAEAAWALRSAIKSVKLMH